MNTHRSGFIALVILLSFVSGLAGSLASPYLLPYNTPINRHQTEAIVQPVINKLIEEDSKVISTIESVAPSVVSIVISQDLKIIKNQGGSPFDLFFRNDPFFKDIFPPQQETPENNPEGSVKQKVGGGSGFFISDDGLILTNKHVVNGDDVEYTVITNTGEEYPAEVVSRDVFNDIAVIKMLPKEGKSDLPLISPISLGNSDELKIGQSVIAIGNALAEFENSATKGIISAKGRQIVASDGSGRGENLSGLIQTDAAINPGNSGGPLINLEGEVIGVNTAIASGANGIGFAIPIDDVKSVIESVKKEGRIVRPILGVMFTMLTPELAQELDLDQEEGALLRGDGRNFAVIPGKPGDKAGLQERDIILKVNDEEVSQEKPLQRIISRYVPGDTLELLVWRKGEEITVSVTLEDAETLKK